MKTEEKIWLASKAFNRGWDFEKLKYSDDLYGREDLADDVWNYVDEMRDYGLINFRESYPNVKLY